MTNKRECDNAQTNKTSTMGALDALGLAKNIRSCAVLTIKIKRSICKKKHIEAVLMLKDRDCDMIKASVLLRLQRTSVRCVQQMRWTNDQWTRH